MRILIGLAFLAPLLAAAGLYSMGLGLAIMLGLVALATFAEGGFG